MRSIVHTPILRRRLRRRRQQQRRQQSRAREKSEIDDGDSYRRVCESKRKQPRLSAFFCFVLVAPKCLRLLQLDYQRGFGNEFASEDARCPRALPPDQNSPQKCAYGLYAEQISGTAFTVPRATNRRSWLYRVRPSVLHKPFDAAKTPETLVSTFARYTPTPNQHRWRPLPLVDDGERQDFVQVGARARRSWQQPLCGGKTIVTRDYRVPRRVS